MPDDVTGFDRADWMKELWAAEQDRALGDELVRRGLVSESRVEDALREQSERPGPAERLHEILLATGVITPSQLEEARRALAREDYSKAAGHGAPLPPPEVEALARDPGRVVADYILVSPLGSGGAGDVWKAWDRPMGRWVAVKIPRAPMATGPAWERFQREALAAGRLNHPGIVPVHAAGEAGGRPYIVMRLIEGETLDRLRLPLLQALEAVRAAALALDYAHRQGVVHRDMKPGNLMMDRAGATWIVDFGIALLTAGEGRLTATGAVLGTAAYMAPEQARGEASVREAALDVYGLGATLYDLVTGHPPFAGGSFLEILQKASREEPVPPRRLNSRLAKDVETVIQKAMDRDPARRYASAAELAEDLRRCLSDEPILARPASRTYRLRKFLRRNRAGSLLAALAAAALVVAALAGIRSIDRSRRLEEEALEREKERERTTLERAASLNLLRETARVSLEAALVLRREGANDRMARFLAPLEAAYRQAAERAPDLAEVDYRMGRMHRAMMDDAAALEYQNRALRKDPSYAPALYERAVLLAKKYAGRRKKGDTEISPEEYTRAQRTITEDCARLEAVLARPAPGMPVTDANLLAARGIVAYYQDRFPEASRLLSEAVERDPDMEEAWDALAKAALQDAGLPEDRRRREAIQLYTRGLARDRGYVPMLLGRGGLNMAFVAERMDRGDDPTAEFAAAERDFLEALRLAPGWGEAWMLEGDLLSNRSFSAATHGQDPEPFQTGAERHFSRALELDPAMVPAWRGRAILRTYRARATAERGEDPSADWAGALEDLGRFIVLAEKAEGWKLADALLRRATVLSDRALQRGLRDAEARSDWAHAEESFARAVSLDGGQARPWTRRGTARLGHARLLLSQGEDPADEFERADADFSAALAKDARFVEGWVKRGVLRSARARFRQARGDDCSADIAAALSDLTRAIELNKEALEAWTERGSLRLWQAGVEEKNRRLRPASEELTRAAADYSQAVLINPSLARRLDAELAALRGRLTAGEQDR